MAKVKPKKEKPAEPVYKTVEEIVAARDQYYHDAPLHEELVARMREMRQTLDGQLAALESKKQFLEAQFATSNAEFINILEESKQNLDTLDRDLRDSVVLYFEAQEDRTSKESKQIADGISVRVNKEYQYDPDEAIKFAIEHKITGILSVNAVEFKKVAPVLKPDFVTVLEKPTAVVTQPKGSK